MPSSSPTIASLTSEQLQSYRQGLKAQLEAKDAALAARREHGWAVAREGARCLREEFGATDVLVFGSVVTGRGFHQRSDIDLAARNVPRETYFKAVAALLNLDNDFLFDLVRLEDAPEGLREHILTEGIPL